MAIAFTCPSCESELKLRDELAGRKVKCPRCGKVVAVAAEDPEEDEQEEQPRKKKKKKRKKKSNIALMAGIAVVALVLVGGGVAIVLAVTGGKKEEPQVKAPAPPKQPAQPAAKSAPPRPGLISAIARRVDRPQRLNELRQIALFYEAYKTERGKPPSTLDDFKSTFKREAPDIVRAIGENYYVVVLNVRGTGIVAYEKEADIHEEHGAAKNDGSVDTISSQQLQTQLAAQGG